MKHIAALTCKDVSVVFARGSSQNYLSPIGQDSNFPNWGIGAGGQIEFIDYRTNKNDSNEAAFVTKEKESAKYFSGIGNRIIKEYPTLSMQFVSLHDFTGKYNDFGYRAVPAFGSIGTAFVSRNAVDARFGYSSIVGESTYGDYRQSIQDGAEELAGYLADEMVRCPSQYTVVGGYSQGAQVVGEAMALMHTRNQDNLLSRLGHVDLFGDPKFNGFKLDTSRINPLQQHTAYPWVRGSANMNEVGSLGPRNPYIPDILTAQTTSWCDFNDLVCGGYSGLSVNDLQAHGHVYSDTGGWIEKAAQETYIAMKQRLSLLAGVADKSANSPLAYWPGIAEPTKLDVMFVMDQTGDESLSLSPDPDYLSNNFGYLANPVAPDGKVADAYYSSIHAGVATYTEFQDGDNIISYPKVPVSLTEDVFSEYGAFRSGWAQSHFLGNYYGGVDLQDSPYGSLKLALDQTWRSDARKVIVLFSNSWGKDTEPGTNLTMKQITAKARAKHVEILPVFTSKTFRANASRVQYVPDANAFYAAMAKQSKGHATEVTDSLSRTLVYDVIMGHIFAPDVTISTGKNYIDPKTKKAITPVIKDTKPIFKKGKKVSLSASNSNSPKSVVTHYSWDLDGNGTIDFESDSPYVDYIYDNPFDGTVCVTISDALGNSTTDCIDIGVTDDDSQVTDAEPAILNAPEFQTNREATDVLVTWPPTEGSIVFRDTDGVIIAITDANSGTFTLHDAPNEAFDLSAQLVNGNDQSDTIQLHIEAAEVAPPPVTGNETTTNPIDNSDTTLPPTDSTGAEAGNDPQPTNDPTGTIETPSDQEVLGADTDSTNLLLADASVSTGGPDTSSIPITALATIPQPLPQKNNADEQPKSIERNAEKVLSTVAIDLSEVVQDYLAWLLVLLLLLVWLYLKSRTREENMYWHNQRKRYNGRKALAFRSGLTPIRSNLIGVNQDIFEHGD